MHASPDFGDARLSHRFWDKVTPEPNTGCWLWTAYTDKQGYGQYNHDGKMQLAHRVSYSVLVAPLEDHVVDHLCRVTSCVNPAHLEAVDVATNTRRGALGFELTSECRVRGHDMSNPANVYVYANGDRKCLQCRDVHNRKKAKCPICGGVVAARHMRKHTARRHSSAALAREGTTP